MNKMFSRVIALLLSILLFSQLIISPIFAAGEKSNSLETNYLTFEGTECEVKTSEDSNKMVITKNCEFDMDTEIIIFPKETALYRITVLANGSFQYVSDEKEIRYNITTRGNVLPLAGHYSNGNAYLATTSVSDDTTTVDVILEAGKEYRINSSEPVMSTVINQLTVTITRRPEYAPQTLFFSNIPSTWITEKAENAAEAGKRPVEDLSASGFMKVEFTPEEIKEYLESGAEEKEKEVAGSSLEGILVDLLLILGSGLQYLFELVFDSNVPLTIDNIVFNRFDQTIIDFSSFGGIQIPSPVTGGIFADEGVVDVIGVLFNGLKVLAIMVYIVMLLYVGIKILLSIGTANQKKYLKYLEYWITGLIFFVVIPYFLPALPVISNSLVKMMEEKAVSMNGAYSVVEVLERLGYDRTYLGEDAEAVELKDLVEKRIAELNSKINGETISKDKAQENIDAQIEESLSAFYNLTLEDRQKALEMVNGIIEMVDAYFDCWDDELEAKYQEKLAELRKFLYEKNYISVELINQILNDVPEEVLKYGDLEQEIREIGVYIAENATNWDSKAVRQYREKLVALNEKLKSKGLEDSYYSRCCAAIERAKRTYLLLAENNAFKGLDTLFKNYKNAVIREEIVELEKMKSQIQTDVMKELKIKAKEQNRLVYAIAWFILLYQMFAVLFMYYKRLIVLIILIVIFPLIMAFYVFDKMGDGKSQSLSTWFKEVFANIFVQVLHAGVYIIIINVGIDVCTDDPAKNWPFLILTVCFLFPAERLLRNILGLSSSTLGGLKNNLGMLALAGYSARKIASGTAKGVKGVSKAIGQKGVVGAVKSIPGAAAGSVKKAVTAQMKQDQDKKDAKEKARDNKKKAAKNRRTQRQNRIASGHAGIIDKGLEAFDSKKDHYAKKISGFAPVKMMSGVKMKFDAARNSNFYKAAKATSKVAARTVKKGAVMAFAGMEAIESMSKEGISSGIYTAQGVYNSSKKKKK